MAADAIEKALLICSTLPDFKITLSPVVKIARNQSLKNAISDPHNALVFIANPHGLHAKKIIEADSLGVKMIFSEKPVCTNLEDLEILKKIKTPVVVFHGYRYLWGPITAKTMIDSGELGEIISIEGRYWQGSEGARVRDPSLKLKRWKADPVLSGGQDVLIDLATHWMDLCLFLLPEKPNKTDIWMHYLDKKSHRDNHVHILTEGKTRSFGSVSKIFHGGVNNLEFSIIGTHGSVQWNFLDADTLKVGLGDEVILKYRSEKNFGTGLPAFHAAGWLEGYIEIIKQAFVNKQFNFHEALEAMSCILHADLRKS